MFIQENDEEHGHHIGISGELSAIPKTINVSCLTMPAQSSNNAVRDKTNDSQNLPEHFYLGTNEIDPNESAQIFSRNTKDVQKNTAGLK